jgi:hypothetical protein
MQLSNHAVGDAVINLDLILVGVNGILTKEADKISYQSRPNFFAKIFKYNKVNHATVKLIAKYLYQLQCLRDLIKSYQDEMLLRADILQLKDAMLNKLAATDNRDNRKYFEYGKDCIDNKYKETAANLNGLAFAIWQQLQIIFLSFDIRQKELKKNLSHYTTKVMRNSLFALQPLYQKIFAGNLAQPLASCFECYKILATLAADVPALNILQNSAAGINDLNYQKYLKKYGIDCRLSRQHHPDRKLQLVPRYGSSDYMDGMTLLAGLVDWQQSVVNLKVFEPQAVAIQIYYVATMLYFIYDVMQAAYNVKQNKLDNVVCFVEKAAEAMSELPWMRQSPIKTLYQDGLAALRAEYAMFAAPAAVVQVGCFSR